MNREILDINDFTLLVEEASSTEPTVDICCFDEPLIAIACYGTGNVDLKVRYAGREQHFKHTNGLALSFYADEHVEFIHSISPDRPLNCIVIATAISHLQRLPYQEGELFAQMLNELVNPSDHFVAGPQFYMTPAMLSVVEQMSTVAYQGKTKMMFYRSQATALLSHFFGQLANQQQSPVQDNERNKLFEAKQILEQNLQDPPSLSELSRRIGLNNFKLKKNFKELFGVPVFKYLQNERLKRAHQLLRQEHLTVQEAAWDVGYDSVSSFSNAFAKKFGYRPSEVSR